MSSYDLIVCKLVQLKSSIRNFLLLYEAKIARWYVIKNRQILNYQLYISYD